MPGWTWEVDAEAGWEERLAALRAYVAAHGWLPPKDHPSGLGNWVRRQRDTRAADVGAMAPERAAALEAVPGWSWDGRRAAAAPAAPPAKRAKHGTI